MLLGTQQGQPVVLKSWPLSHSGANALSNQAPIEPISLAVPTTERRVNKFTLATLSRKAGESHQALSKGTVHPETLSYVVNSKM